MWTSLQTSLPTHTFITCEFHYTLHFTFFRFHNFTIYIKAVVLLYTMVILRRQCVSLSLPMCIILASKIINALQKVGNWTYMRTCTNKLIGNRYSTERGCHPMALCATLWPLALFIWVLWNKLWNEKVDIKSFSTVKSKQKVKTPYCEQVNEN